ncbi:hypothetical protein P3X46_009760 [Hevea brasiliensis]|uniref:SCP domain-containing protein n=1 Tax=Hevea brasiliensis TaxID=3981 RepID=A0ABQ9MMW1_HEVBR|nr:pathogenesis-related protein PR-1 [Hevea brasiliensis]KAJ9181652.1 hypothetical protein P3X46_009760 [Hevea brasiliensis]
MSPFRFLFTILISSLFILSVSSIFPLHRRLPDELHPVVQLGRAAMAHQFIVAHNNVRSAYGLKPLRWNRTLAKYARRWANQRIDDCELQHSPDSPYGENLFWSLKAHWGPAEVVKCWADENVYYNQKTNECINGEMCGHFTQLVWKTTEKVGCGRVECRNNKGFLYVCSYDPPGNYYFEGPFGGTFTKSIVYPPPGSA